MSRKFDFRRRGDVVIMGPPSRARRMHGRRPGLSSVELLVALTLFLAALMVTTPLLVRHSRLLVDQRRYRIALDEVSNQLDRLSALPAEELPAALEQIKINDWTSARLPGASLNSRLEPADFGHHLTLELTYGAESSPSSDRSNDAGRKRKSVKLESWIAAPAKKPASSSPEGAS